MQFLSFANFVPWRESIAPIDYSSQEATKIHDDTHSSESDDVSVNSGKNLGAQE